MNEPLFDAWPRRLNGAIIEPGSGRVRIKPVLGEAIWLPVSDVRELALCAPARKREVLLAAATEATRQDAWRTHSLDGRVA